MTCFAADGTPASRVFDFSPLCVFQMARLPLVQSEESYDPVRAEARRQSTSSTTL